MDLDKIYPSSLEVKYNYLDIDKVFVSHISILKFDANIELLDTLKSMLAIDEMEISMHFERKNSAEFLKELTNIISNSSSEIKSISKNQIDINVLDSVKENAINLRKKIQIDNMQMYLFNAYLVIKDKDEISLINKTRNVINILYSKRIITKMCNFKQKEAYIASLPIMRNENVLKKHTNLIVTENRNN